MQRSWYWGPEPGEVKTEPYSGSVSGTRLVQYFDKARMEINDPDGDRSSPWYVTTGLLVSEMVSGKEQVGDSQFNPIGPAEIAVGGDGLSTDPDAPTYTSFRPVASLTGPGANRAPNRTGQSVTATINRAGIVGDNPSMAFYPGAVIAAYSDELGHNIPQAMWGFLNLKGPVEEGGALKDGGTIADWVFVMGYPITEPYWARIKIDGIYYDALFQMYQRRALAYIPSFPQGWQVQMGNVGAHYYRWLYGGPLPAPLVAFTPTPTPTSTPAPSLTATYTSLPATNTATPPASTPSTTPYFPTEAPTSPAGWPTARATFPPPPETTPTEFDPDPTPTPTFPPVATEPPVGLVVLVRPPYGPPEATFSFGATGLAPNEDVQVEFTDPGGATLYPPDTGGHYTAGPDGQVLFTLVPADTFPSPPLGTWLFELDGLTSGQQGVVGFTLR